MYFNTILPPYFLCFSDMCLLTYLKRRSKLCFLHLFFLNVGLCPTILLEPFDAFQKRFVNWMKKHHSKIWSCKCYALKKIICHPLPNSKTTLLWPVLHWILTNRDSQFGLPFYFFLLITNAVIFVNQKFLIFYIVNYVLEKYL